VRWVEHVASKGEMINAYRSVITKHERKEPLGRPKRRPRLKDNIKMNVKFEISLLLAGTAYSSIPKLEAVRSSETSVYFHAST
jgi:hypothetical protein